MTLQGFDYFRAWLAKWIVVNIASRISPIAVTAIALEIADLYQQSIEVEND